VVDVCDDVQAVEPRHKFSYSFLTFCSVLLSMILGGQHDTVPYVQFKVRSTGEVCISSLRDLCFQQVVLCF